MKINRKTVIITLIATFLIILFTGGVSYNSSFSGSNVIVQAIYPPYTFLIAVALLFIHLRKSRVEIQRYNLEIAPLWRRISSALIDFLFGLYMIIGLFGWIPILLEFIDTNQLRFAFFRQGDVKWYDIWICFPLIFIQMILTYLYFTISHRNGGQTLGNYAMNIKVLGTENESISSGKALYRGFIGLFSSALWFFAIPMALFRKDKRMWHDLVVDTKVVHIPKQAE